MGGKKRIFGFAALLSVLLAVPLVFGLGLVDVPKFSFGGSSSSVESASTASVFVDPAKNITDYGDPIYNVTEGNTVTFHMNITDVTDLFTWQINMSWDSAILNVSRIIPGEFLARSDNQTSSEELGGVVINSTDNAEGYSGFAETILGDVSGIPGPDSGRLVSIEFLIVGYGRTSLTISVSGTLPTTLLNSTGGNITYTKADGFFSNILLGDSEDDRDVDYDDLVVLAISYGSSSGEPAYDARADFDRDGDVDYDDLVPLALNYGKSV